MKSLARFQYSSAAILVVFLFFMGNDEAKAQLKASFKFSPTAGCRAVTVSFTNTSTGSIAKYLWRFGNGNTSTIQNPGASYNNPGKYTVSLTVFDSQGDSSTSVQTDAIIVYNPPSPKFKVSDSALCSPSQVTFTDLTKGAAPISKWDWDFGDGATSTGQNPSHTYSGYGVFTVTLVLTDIYGCTGTLTKSGYISIGTSLSVSFSGDTRDACKVPTTVNFTSNVSGASGNVTYKWNFGDGNTSTSANPGHSYSSFGSYNVSVSVVDGKGCTVSDDLSGYIDIAKITAGFSASSVKVCMPATVAFTPVASSICPSCLNYWNFGDGSSMSAQGGASHTYTTAGTYTVSQKVISVGEGCSDSTKKSAYITVNPVPHDSFYASNNVACKTPLKVNFTGTTSGAKTYLWNFDDGNTNSSSLTPTHTYNNDGIFKISLTATNAQGCSYIYSDTAVHIIQPVPTITVIKGNKGCLPDSVQFRGIFPSGYARANSWLWDFGDSTPVSTDSTPLHIYMKVGGYTVTLKMSNLDSCTGSSRFFLTAGRKPYASFKANPLKQCTGENIKFHIYPNFDSVKATNYIFNFGDGTYGSIGLDTSTTHVYAKPGTYSVTLTAYDYSCGDSFSIKNYITIEPPSAGFVYLNSSCNPQIISFFDSSVGATSYSWNFGDGTSSTIENPIHRFKHPGRYSVLQTVFNSKTKCSASSSQLVQIDSGGAEFSTSVSGNCQSKTYTFSAIMAPGQDSATYSFSWSLGDNATSTKKTVVHTYTKPGQYSVRLITNDNQGCIDTIIEKINVGNKVIQALFSASETFAKCPPQVITFFDTSESYGSPIISWKWYFSDGSTSTDENPQKIFSYPGNYNVALAVVNALGCTDSIMKKGFVVIKGPYGTYTDNVKNGCDSAIVTFTVTNTDADTMTWDMTDGYILYGATVTHTFYDTKRFWTPTLYLTDSGCKYPLFPKDTIAVYPTPTSAFGYDTACNGKITFFLDSSFVFGDTLSSWNWNFGDADSSLLPRPVHRYINSGIYKSRLTVTTSHGCSATIKKNIVVKELSPGFTTSTTKLCILDTVQFLDTTVSNLPITYRLWNFGDGGTSTQTNPGHKYAIPGYYNVSEIVANRIGCIDTVVKQSFLSVGDTNTPPPMLIHHVSATPDGQIGVCFYGFLNPSFSEYLILRLNTATGQYDQVAIDTTVTDTIYYDKNVDVYANSYCYKVLVKTSCDKISDQYFTKEHCSIKLVTTNDTNAVLLNWTPYIGWGGVSSYNINRCRPGDSINYCRIASVSGSQLQFYDSSAICAGRYHYIVSAISPALFDTSRSNVAIGSPIHVNRVPPVSLIVATVAGNRNVQVQWQGLANIKVANYLIERSVDGKNYEILSTLPPGSLSFTDDTAHVQKQSYYYIVEAIDSCGDIGKPSNVGRTIFLQIDTSSFDMSPKLIWNAYVLWPEGVRYYTVYQENPSGGFKTLDYVTDTTYTDTTSNLNGLPYYCYEIIAHRNTPVDSAGQSDTVTSVSNIGCLHEEKSVIYLPNAFTPNGDGLNDRFGPKGLYITQFSMKIYSRWGQLVFSGNSFTDTWDGTLGGKACETGTYIWTASVLGLDNNLRFLYGNVSLLK